MAGLSEIKGFNGWIKGSDPSYIQQMMLHHNAPIRTAGQWYYPAM